MNRTKRKYLQNKILKPLNSLPRSSIAFSKHLPTPDVLKFIPAKHFPNSFQGISKTEKNGFIHILFIGLFPLFLTLTLGVMIVGLSILELTQLQSLCLRSTKDSQKPLKSGMKKIMALNKQAKRLRIQRKKALARLRLAQTTLPADYPAAKAYLMKITLKQTLLRAKQKFILTTAKALARTRQFYWSQRIKRNKKSRVFKITKPQLAITPYPKDSLSPSYKLKTNFESQQAIKAHLNSSVLNLLGPLNFQWIRKYLEFPKQLKINCASTLIKERKWNIRHRPANS